MRQIVSCGQLHDEQARTRALALGVLEVHSAVDSAHKTAPAGANIPQRQHLRNRRHHRYPLPPPPFPTTHSTAHFNNCGHGFKTQKDATRGYTLFAAVKMDHFDRGRRTPSQLRQKLGEECSCSDGVLIPHQTHTHFAHMITLLTSDTSNN